jgi:shikimate kinase
MVKNQVIYIIGFMGSGKSTAGKKLASLLDWSFMDLDQSIEQYTGKSIPDIFSQEGETYFRKIESQLLRNIYTHTNTVISTGGGAPCHDDNMDFMLDTGLTIYLKLTPPQLNSRLKEGKGERPLIRDLGPQELLQYIEKKLSEREPEYGRSDIIVNGFDPDLKDLAGKIQEWLTSRNLSC